MLLEAFKRLNTFRNIREYAYIGFGALYFVDFILIHRVLGICDMISIEGDSAHIKMYEFNKPFNCIRMISGMSHDVLSDIPLTTSTIVWLDYDGGLNYNVLDDVRTMTSRLPSGSLLLLSVNAHPERPPAAWGQLGDAGGRTEADILAEYRISRLRENVGNDKVPAEIRGEGLTGWGLAKACRRIISNEIDEALYDRNGGSATEDNVKFKQIFNFNYSDNARMLTVGGMFFSEADRTRYENCHFESLECFRPGEEVFKIEVPNLTPKEIMHLNAQLPIANSALLSIPGLRLTELGNYARPARIAGRPE